MLNISKKKLVLTKPYFTEYDIYNQYKKQVKIFRVKNFEQFKINKGSSIEKVLDDFYKNKKKWQDFRNRKI